MAIKQKDKIFTETAKKFRSIRGVTSVSKVGERPTYINVHFRFRTDITYDRIRKEVLAIVDEFKELKFVNVRGNNTSISERYDYVTIVIRIK
jgi:hypothetical protein